MKQRRFFSLELISITTSTIALSCAITVRGLFNFGIRFLGASFLRVEDFGVLITLLTIINTSYFFINGNLDRSAMKFIPERKAKNKDFNGLISAYVKGSLIFGLLFTLVVCSFIFLFLYPRINLMSSVIFISFFPLSSMFKTIVGVLHSDGKVITRAALEIAYLSSLTLFVVVFIASGFGINAIIIGFVIGIIVGLVGAFYFLNRRASISFLIDLKPYKQEIYFGLGITIATLGAALLQSIDVYMLVLLQGYTSVGVYGLAYTISLIVLVPIIAFSQVLIPIFAKKFVIENENSKEKKLYGKMIFITLLVSFFLCITVLYSLDFILTIFPDYRNTALKSTIQILLIGMFFYNIGSYNAAYMLAKGVIKALIGLTWLHVIIFFLFGLILIPLYDVIGASLGFTFSCIIAFIITEGYILQKCLGKRI